MSSTRASVFDEANDDLDLSGFAPTAKPEPKVPVEKVREVSEASRFPSREAKPVPAPVPQAATERRQPRRHKTGRTAQLNVRVKPAISDGFYQLADAQGWLVGETVERAYEALRRELAAKG